MNIAPTMSSNHVHVDEGARSRPAHPQHPHAALFDEHDYNGYGNLFGHAQEQPFEHSWGLDAHHLNLPRPLSQPTWQSSTPPVDPQQQPTATGAAAAYNSPGHHVYAQPFTSTPTAYQDRGYASHGPLRHYQQPAIDPALAASNTPTPPSYPIAVPGYHTPQPQQQLPQQQQRHQQQLPQPKQPQQHIQQGAHQPQQTQLRHQPQQLLQHPQQLPRLFQHQPQPHAIATNAAQATQASAGPDTKPVPLSRIQPQPKPAGNSPASLSQIPSAVVPAGPPNLPKPPKGTLAGDFLITDLETLAQTTNSTRLHNFVTISDVTYDLPVNKTAIPSYVPRKSKNELKVLAQNDKRLLEKISKRPPKKAKKASAKPARKSSQATSLLPSGAIKEEVAESSSETNSSDDSDYDSSSDEEPELPPIPATRPREPLEAVKYDTVKALWHAKNSAISAAQIRAGLTNFWEVIRTIKDRWKTDRDAVTQAEAAKKINELPLLKDRVKNQREMMEVALRTASEHGHLAIIGAFSEHKPLLLTMYTFLADRVRDKDYSNPIATSVLELLSQSTTLSTETLEEAKLAKVLLLFSKKGDAATQSKISQILERAAAVSKAKPESAKTSSTKQDREPESKGKVDATRRPQPDASASLKRSRSSDSGANQPIKKQATAGSSPSNTNVAGLKTVSLPVKRLASSTAEKSPSAVAPAAKPKGHQVQAKPTSFFSQLQPSLKKSAAATGSVKTSASLAKRPAPSAPVAAPKPAFSFAETMANLIKPKEPESKASKAEEKRPSETPEEKEKRLRKEARRKLRVKFKPDAALVSIRYFTHDPEEDAGHDPRMLRDAKDVGGEGRMFKQHKDIEMMDVDEDDDQPRQEEYRAWREPGLINFQSLPADERERNYARYGGSKHAVSPAKEAQDLYESKTLMIIYAHPSDVPPSPKEPLEDGPNESNRPSTTPTLFGPPSGTILARIPHSHQPQSQIQPAVAPAATPDFSNLFSIFAQPQQPQQPVNQPTSDLERIFAQHAQQQATPAVTPAPAPAPIAAPGASLEAIFSLLQQPSQGQQPAVPSYTAPQQQSQAYLSALLSGLAGKNTAQASQPSYIGAYGNQQLQQQQQQQTSDQDQKRFQETYEDRASGSNKRQKWGYNKPPTNPQQHYKAGTVPCKYWAEGKCKKGADCTYIHDHV